MEVELGPRDVAMETDINDSRTAIPDNNSTGEGRELISHTYMIEKQLIALVTDQSSSSYIRIEYHPRTGKRDKFVDLKAPEPSPSASSSKVEEPWLPFPSLQDFIFAEQMVQTRASDKDIDFQLKNMHNGTFCEPGACRLNFKSARQLRDCLSRVSSVYPQVCDFLIVLIVTEWIVSIVYKKEIRL
jgi:hypothetical protein